MSEKLTLAFTRCPVCAGLGFVRKGAFGDYRFPRCESCDGIGQRYVNEPPEPRA